MKEHLILLPGFGANEKAWKHQMTHLEDFTTIQAITCTEQKTRQEMVEYVLKIAPKSFFLAGQSMGGWIAQEIAATAPERVKKLILLNTWCRSDLKINDIQYQIILALKKGNIVDVFNSHLSLILHPSRLQDQELTSSIQSMFASFSKETLIGQLHAMMTDYETLPILPKIVAETLIIHGREDSIFPLEEQNTLKEHIKKSKLAIIEECGHSSPLEQPQAVTALMRLFLEFG